MSNTFYEILLLSNAEIGRMKFQKFTEQIAISHRINSLSLYLFLMTFNFPTLVSIFAW